MLPARPETAGPNKIMLTSITVVVNSRLALWKEMYRVPASMDIGSHSRTNVIEDSSHKLSSKPLIVLSSGKFLLQYLRVETQCVYDHTNVACMIRYQQQHQPQQSRIWIITKQEPRLRRHLLILSK